MIPKLNALSALCALACFFMPWLDLRCSGKPILTQTGIQTITGRATPSGNLIPEDYESEKLDRAYLAGGAFLLGFLGSLAALGGFFAVKKRRFLIQSGILSAGALTLLLAQQSRKFPVDPLRIVESDRDFGQQIIQAALAGVITVQTTAWFYVTLGFLGLCVMFGFVALVDRSFGKR